MHIVDTGTLAQGDAGTARACITFGTITPLQDGTLLATGRAGDDKDSDREQIEMYRSSDGGHSWGKPTTPFSKAIVDGKFGTLKLCYLTQLSPGHILAAAMWVDRTTYPGMPLFNADTEGCLPMAILLAESHDSATSWSPWRKVSMPDDIGPPSLTNPILSLADGSLAMSIETNKHYSDASTWHQRAVFLRSTDNGVSWSGPKPVAQDKTGRIFNWDLRCGVNPNGTVASFAWTYDRRTEEYQNVFRRVSVDHAETWSAPQDLGFADQAGPPAILPDGRVVLAWVDRFGDQCIRARITPTIDGDFDPASEVVIYTHASPKDSKSKDTGDLLAGMEMWGFGLPFATTLPDGDVLVTYYAGDNHAMSLQFARLSV